MLIALITILLLGSSGSSALLAELHQAQVRVKSEIADRGRRDELVAVVEHAEKSIKEALKQRGKATGELVALMRSHETKAADAQPLQREIRAEVQAAQEQVIRYRFELKAKMSRDEWSKAFPQP